VQNIYDILSPDAFLRPYIDGYQDLARLYGLIRNSYSDLYVDKELTDKTKDLLRQKTTGGDIEPPGAIHKLGPRELAAIRRSGTSDRLRS
jgi:type I restriction enzyme R subunit